MAWAVQIQISVTETGRPFGLGLKEDVVLRNYSFSPPMSRGESLAAAVAKGEAEIHEHFIALIDPPEAES